MSLGSRIEMGIVGSSYLLGDLLDAYQDWAIPAKTEEKFVAQMRAYGLRNFSRLSDPSLTNLLSRAVEKLFDEVQVAPESVNLVIHFHSLHESVPPYPANVPLYLNQQFGMSKARVFSISQQRCVSFLTILHLLQPLMASDATLRRVLVVGGDVIHQESYRNTDGIAMEGDGAAAVLIDRDHPANRILGTAICTEGGYYRHMLTPDDPTTVQQYRMGSARGMQQTAQLALARAGVGAKELGIVLPHNGNIHFWLRFARQFDLADDVIFTENIGRTGHVHGCDGIINLHDCLESGRVKPGDAVLMGAISFGRSFGCAVLRA